MGDVRWLGGTSNLVSTAANWVGGSVPGDTDRAIWDSMTSYPMGSGTLANTPTDLIVTEGANSDPANGGATLGTSSGAVTIAGLANVRVALRGPVYLTSSGTVTAASFESPIGATVTLSGGTWTTSTWGAGVKAVIGASAVLTNIYSLGATGTVATNGTDVTLWDGYGRWEFNSRDVDTSNIEPQGTVVLKGTSAADTAVNISRGGTFHHLSTGTVALANIKTGGLYTVKGNTTAGATLSSAVIWSGGSLVEAAEGFTLTVSARTFRGPQVSTPGFGSPAAG